MINDITGIILAGGKSTRIGTNKAFLKIGEKTIIDQILAGFESIFREIMIVTSEIKQSCFLERSRVVPDIIPSKGPLGGIYTGLVKSNSFYNFVVACDMPFLNQDLVRYLLEERNGYDVVVPEYKGRLQPLCAVYSKDCIRPIETELSRNSLKITDFFQYVRAKIITEKEIESFDPEKLCFVNINTPQDYKSFKDR